MPLRFRQACLLRDRRGGVLIVFALAIVPIIGLAGIALDYGSARINGARMQTCMDAGVLAGARAARAEMGSETGTKESATAVARAAIDTYVKMTCAPSKTVKTTKLETEISITYGSMSADIRYTGASKSFLGALFGVPSIAISANTQSKASLPIFRNTYLLIDRSPSMGIASTADGRKKMMRLSRGYALRRNDMNCVFACHEKAKYNKSFYQAARQNDIELRIDTVREALLDVVEQTRLSEETPGQYKFGITVFGREVQNVLPMTGDYDAIKSVLKSQVVLSTIYDMGATYPERALQDLTRRVRNDGDGMTASSPKILVVFATDGVADMTEYQSFSRRNAERPDYSPVLIRGSCDGLLRKRVKLAVIETVYTEIKDNPAYDNHVRPWAGKIGPALEACASSPKLYFRADLAEEITAAFQEIFKPKAGPLRLTE